MCPRPTGNKETEAVHSGLGWGWREVMGSRLLCKSKDSFQAALETGEHSLSEQSLVPLPGTQK